jgi:hypothetical protein
MVTIERRTPNVGFSIFRWLKAYVYQVGSTTGTLADHMAAGAPSAPALRIEIGYPSDLTKVQTPALHLSSPDDEECAQEYFGGAQTQSLSLIRVYGFVTGLGSKDQPHILYRDRLKNDVTRLFTDVAEDEGITLYDAESKAEIGAIVCYDTRSRLIPVTAPAVPADRFKFVVEVMIEYE